MLFNTVQFFVFFAVVLVLFYALQRGARKYLLLIASYLFYAAWNVKFVPLLAAITIVDYVAAIFLERARQKKYLVLSLAVNLGFLGFFKYFNFVWTSFGGNVFDIVLPIGISFHTFQSMSYVIDVYRGQQKAIRNFADYALFIAFFPQLVAGPIVRAGEFFADFYAWRAPSASEQLRGVMWMALGLTKKMALADQFALISDAYFGNLAAHPGAADAWAGTVAFALQIFFDFSGYTDMAIGMALLLGFHFPVNFRRPYLAFSITEFWRRWHISLSRWLRDYLYIPLGGNRGGKLATYRNLMLTMLLGGLWHGASWNFVIWGGYHGALLAGERMTNTGSSTRWWLWPFRAVLTFGLVCVGWVFFRAVTFADSTFVLRQMTITGSPLTLDVPVWLAVLAAMSLMIALLEERWEWIERLTHGPAWAYAAVLIVLAFTVELFGVIEQTVPFIYFQF